jgi:hypothetical protein
MLAVVDLLELKATWVEITLCRVTRTLSAPTPITHGFPLRLPELLAIRVSIPGEILLFCNYCWHDPTR